MADPLHPEVTYPYSECLIHSKVIQELGSWTGLQLPTSGPRARVQAT